MKQRICGSTKKGTQQTPELVTIQGQGHTFYYSEETEREPLLETSIQIVIRNLNTDEAS